MPRQNRPRSAAPRAEEPDDDFERLRAGWRRTEQRAGRSYTVQPVAAASALKSYVCPGCVYPIEPGTAHLVAWPQDGVLGDAADLESRRHWHSHCWRLG